ncbi:translation initiation factor IF-2-like [Hylaeus volcanicus]|uniref:translation initiation factor IF-2-like n=1 Tax=Hylaeus volcanicus TaxID=313075 RepID=UPI0023B849A4|nr:translation initiation factor IF-2-like [Hylaeus volcanicus]
MSQRFVCIFLTTVAVSYAVTTKSEFVTSPELDKKEPGEDKLLASIVRGRNSTKLLHVKSNDSDLYDRGTDKQPRTAIHRSESDTRGSSCCGSKYGSGASTRPDSYYNSKVPADGGRYPFQYGERLPADRYGWQGQGQPPGSNGIAGRPGGGNYVGTAHHDGSQAGDRFGSRPSYGSESSRRPAGYESPTSAGYGYGNGGYGGYGSVRPTGHGGSAASGGYGVSGSFANGDEFGPHEPNYPEGNGPPHPNFQTQKAVALKALAGVALIGAAAALATNPILLPIGIVSGRKKRSYLSVNDEDAHVNYILRDLKDNFTKVDGNGNEKKLLVSPTCIARIACEIQKNSWSQSNKGVKGRIESERRFTNLISNDELDKELKSVRIKMMMKAATTVAMNGGNCNVFPCTIVKNVDPKKQFALKL